MEVIRVIAVIGLPTLVAMGIKSLLRDYDGVRMVSHRTFVDFKNCDEGVDGFITDPETFVTNTDFFMPRRHKTLLYLDGSRVYSGDSSHMFLSEDDETVIGEKVASLLETISSEKDIPGELSVRENEVLRLMVEGKINKEIADELSISINTVITHRKNITAKTGIKSVSGLSIYALMNGIS